MPAILRGYVRHSRSFLRDRLLDLLPEPGSYPTPVKGFLLHRCNDNGQPEPAVYAPALVTVAQGEGWVQAGAEDVIYGPGSCFLAGVGPPVFCRARGATPEKPHLALTVELDLGLITRLSALPSCCPRRESVPAGAGGREIVHEMLDCLVRLLELLSRPEQIPFLAPLFVAEIHYRLFAGPFRQQPRALILPVPIVAGEGGDPRRGS